MPDRTNKEKREQAVADSPRYKNRKTQRELERQQQEKERQSYKTDYDINKPS